ncbi:carbon starvation protein A [Candidatus Sumerlaeota bacterium]|nr:carbon starvation protein A [Candidatus Sumerlaeota bacterium]HNM45501.1 carbon starvation CstA family protein [Candidatus Sumerlaeota bacterium]
MDLLGFLAASFAILLAAYFVIGRYLSRLFKLTETKDTPAFTQRDGLDFEPARTSYLLPQHFSAIAAAGPIVGPIMAGVYFGWGPTWLWLILGAIFIGGIHDFTALVASIRHRARSIAEIIREHMNPRAHMLFLIFVWFALIYVIIAFTDVTAQTFVAKASIASADAPGPGVATSSILYLGLAVVMGLCLRKLNMEPGLAKLIFLPLMLLAILAGPYIPINIEGIVPTIRQWLPDQYNSLLTTDSGVAQRLWGYALLVYCFLAAIAPLWLLLQPRGELGGYFLYLIMVVSLVGIVMGAVMGTLHINQPFFRGWEYRATPNAPTGTPLFPILFITVACGACSGFHSIIASGTTSKQLERESDAKPVGYGSMLLEAFFSCISLATLMVIVELPQKPTPNGIYADGIATFARTIFTPFSPVVGAIQSDKLYSIFYQFALLCFATFVFDTLDACTRLARYVLMEAFNWKTGRQAVQATVITLAIPALFVAMPPIKVGGSELPLWQVFWGIFGSSNQLLAALTLLGVTVWLARKKMAWWLTFFPTVFMMVMTLWSLILNIPPYLKERQGHTTTLFSHLKFGISVMLILLSCWLIVEALITWRNMTQPPADGALEAEPEPA